MASILRATPCASRPGPQRQRQGRTSSSGCSSRGPPSATVRTSNTDGRPAPRENISISVSLLLLLKIAARNLGHADTRESALALGVVAPYYPWAYPPPLRARQAAPWLRLHGRRTTIPFSRDQGVRAGR